MIYKKIIPFMATIFLLSACDSHHAEQEFWIGENGELTLEGVNPPKAALEPTDILIINANIPQISDVKIGMTLQDLNALNHTITTEPTLLNGNTPRTAVNITLASGHKIHSLMSEYGRLVTLGVDSTSSIHVSYGIRIGSSIEQVKLAYPHGSLEFISEPILGANYFTGTHLLFSFYASKMAPSCFELAGKCDTLEYLRVNSLTISGKKL